MIGHGSFLGFARRLFHGGRIPFYVENGTVHLPSHLDGSSTDTDIKPNDHPGIRKYLKSNSQYFIHVAPKYRIYPSKDSFNKVYQPDWLRRIRDDVDKTIKQFIRNFPRLRYLQTDRIEFDFIADFESKWTDMLHVLSASLYCGQHFGVLQDTLEFNFSDLVLYTPTVESVGVDSVFRAMMLIKLVKITEVLRCGILPSYVVIDRRNRVRDLYDPAKSCQPICYRYPTEFK